MNFPLLARMVILEFVRANLDKSDTPIEVTMEMVFIVWFSKTLQNWKALVSTTLPDQAYYELTYNGDSDELYIDKYVKVVNNKIEAFSDLAVRLELSAAA